MNIDLSRAKIIADYWKGIDSPQAKLIVQLCDTIINLNKDLDTERVIASIYEKAACNNLLHTTSVHRQASFAQRQKIFENLPKDNLTQHCSES